MHSGQTVRECVGTGKGSRGRDREEGKDSVHTYLSQPPGVRSFFLFRRLLLASTVSKVRHNLHTTRSQLLRTILNSVGRTPHSHLSCFHEWIVNRTEPLVTVLASLER